MSTTDVDGYTAADPIEEDDWEDVVEWEVMQVQQVRHQGHNRDGYFALVAGGAACTALGHKPDPENEWLDDDEHERGWDGEHLCQATAYGSACTECESEDCPWEPADPQVLWAKVRA